MKIAAHSDNNPFGMEIGSNTSEEALREQYGEGFIGRVYRTALVVWAITALIIFGRIGIAALVGFTLGTAISLGSLRLIELTVRNLVRPDVQIQARWFRVLCLVKLPVLTIVMAGAAWAVMSGRANVFALVGGVVLVQAVIFLKAVSGLLVASLPPLPRPALQFRISDRSISDFGFSISDCRGGPNRKSKIRNPKLGDRAVVQPASD